MMRVTIKQPRFMICILAFLPEEILGIKPAEKLVPLDYYNFLLLFSKKEASALPSYRYMNHEVPLLSDTKPPLRRIYLMADLKLKEV